MPTQNQAKYLRNFIFGVEDSLVSTVGLISGVAAAGVSRKNIILTGVVLVCVEAFSMGVGTLVSETTAKEYEQQSQEPMDHSFGYAAVMLLSYLFAGLLVILPYIVVKNWAFVLSIAVSLMALFFLGVVSAWLSHIRKIRQGALFVFLGGAAIVLGIAVGQLVEMVG